MASVEDDASLTSSATSNDGRRGTESRPRATRSSTGNGVRARCSTIWAATDDITRSTRSLGGTAATTGTHDSHGPTTQRPSRQSVRTAITTSSAPRRRPITMATAEVTAASQSQPALAAMCVDLRHVPGSERNGQRLARGVDRRAGRRSAQQTIGHGHVLAPMIRQLVETLGTDRSRDRVDVRLVRNRPRQPRRQATLALGGEHRDELGTHELDGCLVSDDRVGGDDYGIVRVGQRDELDAPRRRVRQADRRSRRAELGHPEVDGRLDIARPVSDDHTPLETGGCRLYRLSIVGLDTRPHRGMPTGNPLEAALQQLAVTTDEGTGRADEGHRRAEDAIESPEPMLGRRQRSPDGSHHRRS